MQCPEVKETTQAMSMQCHSGEQTAAESAHSSSLADVRLSDGEENEVAGVTREARNMAEKNRRDKLNASIQELSTMVSRPGDAPGRKLDKTGVLRYATHGLRLHHVYGNAYAQHKQRKKTATVFEETKMNLLMRMLDKFLISLTCNGQIVLVSTGVQQLLGHSQFDLYGQSIYHITHPDDHMKLRQELVPSDIKSLFNCQFNNDDSTDGTKPQQQIATIDNQLHGDRRCFTVRLARVCTRSDSFSNYELVRIEGCFRRSDALMDGKVCDSPILTQMMRRSRGNNAATAGVASCSPVGPPQHDAFTEAALHGISGNDIVFVAVASIVQKTINLMREPSSCTLEYRTRHLIDGRIVDCDQRIGLVAGYLKEEVSHLSPFSFMHQDDVRWVILALRQMYDHNSNYGESCYRLLTRNGNFIYLQTRGFLEIDRDTNQVHSFICINTLLDEEEGKRRVQRMKDMYSTMINADIPRNVNNDVPASRDPQQLERIVFFLIEDLQKTSDGDTDTESRKPLQLEEIKSESLTPPPHQLALVPPEPSSVKDTITKSVTVVNVTADSGLLAPEEDSILKRHLSTVSPEKHFDNIALSTPPMSPIEIGSTGSTNQTRSSVLQRTPPTKPAVTRVAATVQPSPQSRPGLVSVLQKPRAANPQNLIANSSSNNIQLTSGSELAKAYDSPPLDEFNCQSLNASYETIIVQFETEVVGSAEEDTATEQQVPRLAVTKSATSAGRNIIILKNHLTQANGQNWRPP